MKKRRVLLTTQDHREELDGFADAMRSASSREGWRSSEVLTRFLEAGYLAIRGRLLVGEAFEKNEAEYMKIVSRCRHPKETMTDLAAMLGFTGAALTKNPRDFIGPVFAELSAEDGWGQFFTPFEVSYMIAKMTVPDAAAALGEKPYITVQEPACGVGGMVLAANVAFREIGLDVARQVHWLMIDVDHRAFCAAYIQAAFTDASAIVVHGNTLTLETRQSMPTPAAVLFPKTFETNVPPRPKPEEERQDPPPPAPPAQLSLF